MEINKKDYEELVSKVEHLEEKIKAIETRLDADEKELDQIREIEITERPLY